MEFRKATIADATGVAEVLKECYNIKSVDEGKKVFEDERVKGHNYIVAVVDGKIIGLTTWLTHGLFKHGLAELDRIALLPNYRGKGISKQLFDALVEEAKGKYVKNGGKLRKLYLLTHADNSRAQAFYSKMGFKHETTLKKHYYDDKDEFLFSVFF